MATLPVKVYSSEQPGAPVLSGTAGAMVALLKACLVDGFGLKTCDGIAVASGIATAAFNTGHSFIVGSPALIAGATPAGLNGEFLVLSAGVNTVTFACPGVVDGAATGTITAKVAPAQWVQAFAATNVGVFKSASIEATGLLLRVDDTGTTNGRVVGYEAMSGASAGVAPFPMPSQVSGGGYWPKSSAASATARPWYLIADDRGVWLAAAPTGADRYTLLWAGDISSLKSGDAYSYALTCNQSDQANAATVPDGCCGYSHRSARGGAYIARAHTAIGQSTAVQRLGAHHNGATSDVYAGVAGYSVGVYPNGVNNGLVTAPLELYALGLRGVYPGLLHPVQDCANAFATGSVVDGTNDLAGKKLLAIRVAPPSGAVVAGTVFIDITGPWVR